MWLISRNSGSLQICRIAINRKVYQGNNLVPFGRKPIGTEEFLNRMFEALGIIIDRCPKGRPRKMESQIIEKIGCVVLAQ